jgi:hypothetical protein
MSIKRGSVALLEDPVATELLQSDIPARLAYTGIDGLPRVVPVWSEWNGRGIVIVSPATSAKLKESGQEPCEMYAGVVSRMPEPRRARITVTPNWVSINDFETRFPPQIAPYLSG